MVDAVEGSPLSIEHADIRLSRSNSSRGFQVKVLTMFQVVPSSLDSGRHSGFRVTFRCLCAQKFRVCERVVLDFRIEVVGERVVDSGEGIRANPQNMTSDFWRDPIRERGPCPRNVGT